MCYEDGKNHSLMEIYEMMDKGMNDEALVIVKQALEIIDEKSNEYLSWLNVLGYIYCNLENYSYAFDVYDRYIELSEQQQDFENLHMGFHQKAMVFRLNKQYSEALDYIKREKELIDNYFKDDKLKISVNEYEYGYLLYLMDHVEEANKHMRESLKQALKTEDVIAQACAYRGLAEISYKNNDLKQANGYIVQAYDLFIKAEDSIGAEEVIQIRKKMNSAS